MATCFATFCPRNVSALVLCGSHQTPQHMPILFARSMQIMHYPVASYMGLPRRSVSYNLVPTPFMSHAPCTAPLANHAVCVPATVRLQSLQQCSVLMWCVLPYAQHCNLLDRACTHGSVLVQ
eukprot:scaffold122749_cov23-Tisochrysis_lutea.AAC.1